MSIVERDVRSCYWLLRGDPCRLARQVKKIGWLNMAANPMLDPCRLVRQVKKIGWLTRPIIRCSTPAGSSGR
ncbi:MAG: hypothetical protein GX594_06455 [Pirellulaceae bacterium]|nr:hypothetical protein [Pirellulaceae bacterium]